MTQSGHRPFLSTLKGCYDTVDAAGATMRRRDFIKIVAGIAALYPLAGRAQQPERVRRIGRADVNCRPEYAVLLTAFRSALTKLGWTEGSNLRTEVRWGAGDADKIRSFAKELVDLRPDAIVGHSTPVVSRPCSRDADNSHRIRECRRPNRQWLRRKSRASGRQFDRFHD